MARVFRPEIEWRAKESLKLRRLETATAPIEMETPHRTRDSVALSPSRSEAAWSVPTVGNSLARPTTNSGQSTHSSAALWDSSLPSLLERRLAGAKAFSRIGPIELKLPSGARRRPRP